MTAATFALVAAGSVLLLAGAYRAARLRRQATRIRIRDRIAAGLPALIGAILVAAGLLIALLT